MIYRLTFEHKKVFAQAKGQLHLLQSYEKEYEDFHEILSIEEISEKEAKGILLSNPEYEEGNPNDLREIPLFDTVVGDDFVIVGSTEWE